MKSFRPGDEIGRREVLHGLVWLASPVTVVEDDGNKLAVRVDPGNPLYFPQHPYGPHLWSFNHTEWGGSIVLQLFRQGDLYSVWKIFEPAGRSAIGTPTSRHPSHATRITSTPWSSAWTS